MATELRFLGVDLAWGEGAAGRRPAASGVAALDGRGTVLDAGLTYGVRETADWVESTAGAAALVLVDAPLVVENASGLRPCEREVGRRYGRWKVSAHASNLATRALAGVALRRELEQRGFRYADGRDGPPAGGRTVTECYPHTTLVGVAELGYDRERPRYKRRPRGTPPDAGRRLRAAEWERLVARLAGLRDADPPLELRSHPATRELLTAPPAASDAAHKRREDLLDAVLCAWTAAFWRRHGLAGCQVLGAGAEPSNGRLATIVAPARPEQRPPGTTEPRRWL